MESFLNGIKNLGVFMIVAQTVMNFMPAGATGGAFIKYAKPIVGLMLLLKIFTMIIGGADNLSQRMDLIEAEFEIEWENYMERVKSEFVVTKSGENEE